LKAIILVGGKATRLLPLSVNTPKSLVPVVNVPILEHVINHVREHGIREIVLAQGHLAQSIVNYFGDGSRFGVTIFHSYEDIPLGSAGAARNAEKYLRDDTFLVLNSDIFSDLDFTAMLHLHRKSGAKATIATTPVEDPTMYGLVDSNSTGRVQRFLEKPKREEVTTNMINAGAWFVEADVLSRIPSNTNFSFERNVFPQLLAEGQPVYAFGSSGYWVDMGTPEKYLQLHRDLLNGKCRRYQFPAGEILRKGKGCRIDGTARFTGKIIIGPECTIESQVIMDGPVVLGADCVVEKQSVIQDSVLWRNVRIGPGVTVKSSILADNCVLEAGCVVDGVVLGDGVTVGTGVKVATGSKFDPGTRVGPSSQPG
jgi:mannose-1-phosphate guanylyltransferase